MITIITPTICRPSLIDLCKSIDAQRYADWEHLIGVDKRDEVVLSQIELSGKRRIAYDGPPLGYWGNPMKHHLWQQAKGDYIFYLDDDHQLMHDGVLERLARVTAPWGIFQLLVGGRPEPIYPIKLGRSDGNSVIVRRNIGRWPNLNKHETDGIFIEDLLHNHEYQPIYQTLLIYGEGHS